MAYSKLQLVVALVLLIASKLTGPVFAAVSIIAFFLAAFIRGDRRTFFARHKAVLGQLTLGVAVAFVVVGYSPYVENLLAGKHLFYPVMGSDKLDIMNRQASPHFLAMGTLHKLFLSYFSIPSNCLTGCEGAEPTLVPSAIHMHDAIGVMHTPDARFAGFGLFFGIMLILCLVSLFWKKKDSGTITLFLCAALVIVLIHPQSWWARYVPMLYLVPFLVTAGLSTNRKLFHAVIVLGLLNSVIAGASVGRWVMLQQINYHHAVAAVRAECEQNQIALAASRLDWEPNLRDDRLLVVTNGIDPDSECPVNFGELLGTSNK